MLWWLEALLAASPILLILVAMVVFKRSATTAGAFGLLLTLALTLLHFGFPSLASAPLTYGLVGSLAEATFTAGTILWIILGALCIHRLQMQTGAIETLRDQLGRLTDDPRLLAILIAWFFALFLEGAAGFGTPVALAAPFLVGFGFKPVQAVTITLLGHAVGVSFGAVGTPVLVQIAASGFSGLDIARVTSDVHALVGGAMLALVLWRVHRRGPPHDAHPVSRRALLGWFLLAATGFLVPMWLIAHVIGPELPTMAGAVVGGAGFIAALKLSGRRLPPTSPATTDDEPQTSPALPLGRALSPYLVVIALVLLTRLIGPLESLLRSVAVSWQLFENFEGRFEPLFHPGTLLILGFLIGARLQRTSAREAGRAALGALKMVAPVTLALVAMLSISRLMVHAEMIDALAEAAARTGAAWPLFAPVVGTLGTFVTGSATASNILFTDFQLATAERLGLDPLRLIGAQGVGAAVGNTIAPHNIIAGCATVGIATHEGEVLRRTLGACALYLLLGGLLVLYLSG
ncbi:L-lactate permease [Lujinxingia litoralis]|uniref:L-lactate permease n=1 Tax=Lujinxingia litoralis TaxID=2211119 RepID=A0A328C2J5_9DELT|nr:L-lactate permease [Lujinxingia litoralis]RAL19987.1 L-lactate permease [Lujinxingia litoralis]